MTRRAFVWGIAPLVVGVALAQVAQAAIDVSIVLVGSAAFPRAKGKVRFRQRDTVAKPKRQLSVGVDTPLPGGTVVNVSLGGVTVGSITLDIFGNGTVDVNSPTLPANPAGMTLAVTLADGTLVASGTF